MSPETARRAVVLFLPRMTRTFHVCFYGGEPLLNFDLIRETVPFIRSLSRAAGRRPRFSLTTNGSLCTEEILGFLEKHRFSVVLSYDGHAQDVQRMPGSSGALRRLIARFVESGRVRLEVNSVFTPETVTGLFGSLRELVDRGVPSVRYSLSIIKPWREADLRKLSRELRQLRKFAAAAYGKTGTIPVQNFREDIPCRVRYCPAGKDRMAVDPDGRIWGCALFADWARDHGGAGAFRRFGFGTIERFAKSADSVYARIFPNYGRFSVDQYRTPSGPCFLCPRLKSCWVCPVNAGLAGGKLDEIPPSVCGIQKIKAGETDHLIQDLESA